MPAVVKTDMKNYAPATVAATEDDEDIGGAISATEVTNGSLNELMYTMEAQAEGGGDQTQYAKCFHKNTNASEQIDSYGIWIANAIDDLGVSSLVELVSTSASDGSSKKVRLLGFNSSGDPIQDEVTMNGVTPVTSSLSFVGKIRAEVRLSSGSALTTAAGNITITHNSTNRGMIPAGAKTATNEGDIGLEATLGGSTTIATPSTAPL